MCFAELKQKQREIYNNSLTLCYYPDSISRNRNLIINLHQNISWMYYLSQLGTFSSSIFLNNSFFLVCCRYFGFIECGRLFFLIYLCFSYFQRCLVVFVLVLVFSFLVRISAFSERPVNFFIFSFFSPRLPAGFFYFAYEYYRVISCICARTLFER